MMCSSVALLACFSLIGVFVVLRLQIGDVNVEFQRIGSLGAGFLCFCSGIWILLTPSVFSGVDFGSLGAGTLKSY